MKLISWKFNNDIVEGYTVQLILMENYLICAIME